MKSHFVLVVSLLFFAGSPFALAAGSKDACSILTPEEIKKILGLDFLPGTTKPSNMQGSTCSFKQDKGYDSLILQLGKASFYYEIKSKDNKPLTEGVDKGFFTGPMQGNSYVQAVKGDQEIVITVYAKKPYTASQVKTLVKTIAGKL